MYYCSVSVDRSHNGSVNVACKTNSKNRRINEYIHQSNERSNQTMWLWCGIYALCTPTRRVLPNKHTHTPYVYTHPPTLPMLSHRPPQQTHRRAIRLHGTDIIAHGACACVMLFERPNTNRVLWRRHGHCDSHTIVIIVIIICAKRPGGAAAMPRGEICTVMSARRTTTNAIDGHNKIGGT